MALRSRDDELVVHAFVVSQEDVLADVEAVPELHELDEDVTDRELQLYRVSMDVLEQLTGLDFGPLSDPGVSVNELGGGEGLIEPLTELAELYRL